MAQETYDTQVGASATVRNALADTDLAIAPSFGFLTVYGRHEATSTGKIKLSMAAGDTQLCNDSPMTINDVLTPNRQEDIIGGPWPIIAGKSLRAKLVESTGAATDLNVVFSFVEAPRETVLRAGGFPI